MPACEHQSLLEALQSWDEGLASRLRTIWDRSGALHSRQTRPGVSGNGADHCHRVEQNAWRLVCAADQGSPPRKWDLFALSLAACCHDFDKGLPNCGLPHGQGSQKHVLDEHESLVMDPAEAVAVGKIIAIHDLYGTEFRDALEALPNALPMGGVQIDPHWVAALLKAGDVLHLDFSRVPSLAVDPALANGLEQQKILARKCLLGWILDGSRIVVGAYVGKPEHREVLEACLEHLRDQEWGALQPILRGYGLPYQLGIEFVAPMGAPSGRRTAASPSRPELRRFLAEHFPPPSTRVHPFLTREELSRQIREALEAGPSVAVVGAGGVGKTWLAADFASRLGRRTCVLWYNCDTGDSPLRLASTMGRDLREVRDGAKSLRNALAGLLLASTPSRFDLLALARLLAEKHVRLFLDNFHLANESRFVPFLAEYCNRATRGGIVLITREMPKQFTCAQRVDLGNLSPDDTREYIRMRWERDVRNYDASAWDHICEVAKGYFPFLNLLGPQLAIAPPHQLCLARLGELPNDLFARLARDEYELMVCMACFRSSAGISLDALKLVAGHRGLEVRAVVGTLQSLRDKGLIDVLEAGAYQMNDSMRDLLDAYLEQPDSAHEPPPRNQIHGYVAQYYQGKGDDPLHHIEAFYHLVAAGEAEKATLHLVDNEKYIFDMGFTGVLEECLCDLPDALSKSGPVQHFLRVSEHLIRGRIDYYRGRPSEALERYDTAFTIMLDTELPCHGARKFTHLKIAGYEYRGLAVRKMERFDEAVRDFKACESLAREAEHPVWRGHALADLGMVYRETGQLEAAIRHISKGMEVRRRLLEEIESKGEAAFSFWTIPLAHIQLADQLALLSYCYLEQGDLDTAEQSVEEAWQHLSHAGRHAEETYYRGRILCASALVHARRGHWSDALACAQEAFAFPRERKNLFGAIAGQYCLGVVFLMKAQAEGTDGEAEREALANLRVCLDQLQATHVSGMNVKLARVCRALEVASNLCGSTEEADTDYAGLGEAYAKRIGKRLADVEYRLALV